MKKHLHIIILIIVFSLTSTGAAADDPKGQYYPLDNLYVYPYYGDIEEFADDDIPIVEKTGLPSLKEYLHTSVIIGYSRAFGLPPVIVTELAAVFFLLLGGGALTCLFTRRLNPVRRNPRTQAVYSLIQENPGITMAELEEITGYSRGSINYSITKLILSDRIKKIPLKKTNHYYYIEDEENQSLEFMKQIIREERPQKIFQTIMNSPGITQKELADTTDIPATTLQWHLTQLAKYEAIKSSREKNTISYKVLPKYIWLYHSITKEKKNEEPREHL